MNKEDMIKVIQGAIDGKTIQWRDRDSPEEWSERGVYNGSPIWNFSINDYRIKPEPREFTLYGDVLDELKVLEGNCNLHNEWKHIIKDEWKHIIKVREILYENS